MFGWVNFVAMLMPKTAPARVWRRVRHAQDGQEACKEKPADAAFGGVNAECPTSCPSSSYRCMVGRHPRRSAPGAFSIRILIENGF
jgi:hypothetical protein